MMFHVGQKVVCVDASGFETNAALVMKYSGTPVEGCVYTVRGILSPDFIHDDLCGILLEEFCAEVHPIWQEEYGFRSVRFRPLTEIKTDISLFTAMLNPSKHEVDA
jgi:hypothetical protein